MTTTNLKGMDKNINTKLEEMLVRMYDVMLYIKLNVAHQYVTTQRRHVSVKPDHHSDSDVTIKRCS